MNVTGPNWWWVNNGWANVSMLSGNRPLPEPVLTQIHVPMLSLGHSDFMLPTLWLLMTPVIVVMRTTGTASHHKVGIMTALCYQWKMPSYQHRKSHWRNKITVRLSYLHNGISYMAETWDSIFMLKSGTVSHWSLWQDWLFPVVINVLNTSYQYPIREYILMRFWSYWSYTIIQNDADEV